MGERGGGQERFKGAKPSKKPSVLTTLYRKMTVLSCFYSNLVKLGGKTKWGRGKCPLAPVVPPLDRKQTCNESNHFRFESSHLVQIFSRVESLYKFQWVESLKTSKSSHALI